MFITFEGLDGSGKSTLVEIMLDILGPERPVAVIREPGGSVLGEQIRPLLADPTLPISDTAELLLFAAARTQVVEGVIRPALARGELVLCDRFIDSTYAYQGGGRGLERRHIEQVIDVACGPLRPDWTILATLPEVERQQRLRRRGDNPDRIEREGQSFYKRVEAAYREIALREPLRVTPLSTMQSRESLRAELERLMRWRGLIIDA